MAQERQLAPCELCELLVRVTLVEKVASPLAPSRGAGLFAVGSSTLVRVLHLSERYEAISGQV